jgi:phospholipid/cholesterol/gamma-HCH transport system ATP-binding protein
MTDEAIADDIVIDVKNLSYAIAGKQILKNISFSINRGEIFCIVGMSGSGKTSLLHCIGGLSQASAGEIWVEGKQIVGMNERDLNSTRESMGMVFQYAALFDSLTVFENVAFGLRRRRRLIEDDIVRLVREKLELSAVSGTEKLLPSELSGGMSKRVGLARALAMEPGILLYDEPTSGLDPVVATVIDDLIVSLKDKLKVTSVVVSHNMQSVFRTADRIAMIHEGKLMALGTSEEIKNTDDPLVRQFIEGRSVGPIEMTRR